MTAKIFVYIFYCEKFHCQNRTSPKKLLNSVPLMAYQTFLLSLIIPLAPTTTKTRLKHEKFILFAYVFFECFSTLNLFAFIHAWSLLPILLPIIPYVYRNKNLLTNLPIRILLSLQRLWTCIQQWVSNCRNILFMSEHDSERDCLKSNWEIKISSSRLLI